VPVAGQEQEAVAQMKKYLENADEIAAFIFEPLIQGAGGMVMYEPEVLEELIALAKDKGVITIADEIMTGFGRTGKMFATDYIQTKPDIYCMSKGLTGGAMALGVTTCTQEIFDAFLSEDRRKTLFHSHSFTANPLACTAALASLDLLLLPETQAQIKALHQSHVEFAQKLKAEKASAVDSVRVRERFWPLRYILKKEPHTLVIFEIWHIISFRKRHFDASSWQYHLPTNTILYTTRRFGLCICVY
jgi:adenosylmethionine-8-amino-7-oxononanoate aminotransferase